MSASIGASLSNARTATATSSNGLAYMWEMLHIASSMRAPIIMELVCRSISGPLNIHNDHSDAMGMKDTGWIMLFSKNNQDVYDNTIIGTMIAENSNVLFVNTVHGISGLIAGKILEATGNATIVFAKPSDTEENNTIA